MILAKVTMKQIRFRTTTRRIHSRSVEQIVRIVKVHMERLQATVSVLSTPSHNGRGDEQGRGDHTRDDQYDGKTR